MQSSSQSTITVALGGPVGPATAVTPPHTPTTVSKADGPTEGVTRNETEVPSAWVEPPLMFGAPPPGLIQRSKDHVRRHLVWNPFGPALARHSTSRHRRYAQTALPGFIHSFRYHRQVYNRRYRASLRRAACHKLRQYRPELTRRASPERLMLLSSAITGALSSFFCPSRLTQAL